MVIRGKSHLLYKDAATLEALYDSYYSVSPPYMDTNRENNESDDFSFGLNNFIIFYVDMYRLTGAVRWLDLAEDTINHILDNTDVRRVEKGEIAFTPLEDPIDTVNNYYQAPYPYQINGTPVPGWSSYDGSTGGLRCQILQDGQILAALCHFAEYVIDNNITDYVSLANTCLVKSREVLDSHVNSYKYNVYKYDMTIAGSYYYPGRDGGDYVYSHPLAYNHDGGATKAALICNKYEANTDYVNRVEQFMQYVRDSRTYHESEDRFVWPYKQSSPDSAEDLNHGSYSLGAYYKAYQLGMAGVTKAEMTTYTNSILYTRRDGLNDTAEKVDRSGTAPTGEVFDVGQMSYLGEFDYSICEFGRDVLSINYIAKYSSHFAAHAALLLNLKDGDR